MEIRISEADRTDAKSISALIVPLAERYVTHEFPAQARLSLLASMGAEGIKRLMENGCDYHLARGDGKLVGVVGIRHCSHLYHLFVDEAHQRRGIARELWQAAMAKCMAAGANGRFTVNASRYAVPFYERLGFVAGTQAQERNGIVTIPMEFHVTRSSLYQDKA